MIEDKPLTMKKITLSDFMLLYNELDSIRAKDVYKRQVDIIFS